MRRSNRRNDAGPTDGPFICEKCGQAVPSAGEGTGTKNRNHCPACLWSLHVDLTIGDRLCGCRGLMEPLAVTVRYKGEWALIHRCKNCGMMRTNRLAGDDNELALISLAVRPLASPPFPLERLGLAGAVRQG